MLIGSMDGYKLFLLVRPVHLRAKTPPHVEDAWSLMDMEDASVNMIILKPGEFL